MKIAIGVFGVPGVGKSTLCQAHALRVPEDRHVGGSSIVKAILAPHSVRDLDGWPSWRQDEVRNAAIARLTALRDDAPRALLVDGHFTLRNRATGEVGSVVTDADRAFYDAYVLVDADVDTVLRHVHGDARSRHGQAAEQIVEHLESERLEARRTSERAAVPLYAIAVSDLDARCRQLSSFVSNLAGAR